MKFKKWLTAYMEEKNIQEYETFEFTYNGDIHIFDYGYVISAILLSSKEEQRAIKDMLVKIDFVSADVKSYLRHLAKALV